jgi:predicted dehydrogenase
VTSGGRLRVACVGAGYFSRFHYDSWRRLDRVALVGACNRTLAKAEATGAPAYDDLARMLDETRPDLLDVILPPEAQADALRVAFAAGAPNVICQKPFGRDLEEARALTREAEAAGARLIVHENFRFQPWYRAIRSALDARLLGDLVQVSFRLRPGDGQGPDAYLDRQPSFRTMARFLVRETAVHYADTFRYLLGPPSAVYADLRRINPAIRGEDAGYILFDHPGGVRALFDGARALDHAADDLRRTMGEGLFEGTEGTLRLLGDGSVRHRRFGAREETVFSPPVEAAAFGGDCVHALQSHVVAGILDGEPIENLAADYLPIVAIERAIYRSAEEGRKIALEDR